MVTFAFLTDGKILIILIPLASLGVLAQPAIQAILSKSVGDDRQGAIDFSRFFRQNSKILFPWYAVFILCADGSIVLIYHIQTEAS